MLYKTLPISDKSTLLNFNEQKRVFNHPDETFKPRQIATKKFDINNFARSQSSGTGANDASPIAKTKKSA